MYCITSLPCAGDLLSLPFTNHRMNFLAHMYLSFGDSKILTGQFIADEMRGNAFIGIDPHIVEGIRLHRFIDDFTDHHPENLRLRALLRPHLGLLSPVAMDVWYDHMLAREWSKFHEMPLHGFIEESTGALSAMSDHMPEKSILRLQLMAKHNWLLNYATIEGIEKTFEMMAKRFPFAEKLAHAPKIWPGMQKNIEETFFAFIPDLISAAEMKIARRNFDGSK